MNNSQLPAYERPQIIILQEDNLPFAGLLLLRILLGMLPDWCCPSGNSEASMNFKRVFVEKFNLEYFEIKMREKVLELKTYPDTILVVCAQETIHEIKDDCPNERVFYVHNSQEINDWVKEKTNYPTPNAIFKIAKELIVNFLGGGIDKSMFPVGLLSFLYQWRKNAMCDFDIETFSAGSVPDSMLQQCACLFSSHYGKWAKNNPNGLDGNVKITPKRLKVLLSSEKTGLVLCRLRGELFGYATFVLQNSIIWITQLVVHSGFRRYRIAQRLLRKIYSSGYICGLVSANPLAVRIVEKVTGKEISPITIKKHKREIWKTGKKYIDYISGLTSNALFLTNTESRVNTEFYVEHQPSVLEIGGKWHLGKLPAGWEWFAFAIP